MRYRRDRTPGACYFFTLVTEQRQQLLTLPGNIERLRESFLRERERNEFTLDAVVVLPDHLHCMMVLPAGDFDYSGRLARIKRYFSVGCSGTTVTITNSRASKRERPVWQRRFWEHKIRDDKDWRNHMDYIHYNPVKHGYTLSPWDWPFSSLPKCAKHGWYDSGWGINKPFVGDEMMVGE